MKVQNASLWSSSMLAVSLVGGLSLLGTACSSGDAGKVTVQFAPKSAMAQKLEACTSSKLSASLKTFETASTKVCRKGTDGKAINQDVVPSFQMISKRGRVGIDHVAAFQLTYKDVEAAPQSVALSAEAKMTSESVATQFLSAVCGPVIQSPFKRSGLAARFTFRPLRDSDRKASGKSESKKSGSSSDDTFFDGQIVSKADVSKKSGEVESISAREVEKVPNSNAINSVLELVMTGDSSISIKDDLSEISSGPLKDVLSGNAAPSEQQLLFCGQLLIRMAENVGLTKGRDCESLEKASEAPVEEEVTVKSAEAAKDSSKTDAPKTEKPAIAKSDDRLMKSGGHRAAALPTLKLAESEVLEIMTPVCGDLNPKSAATPAGKTP